MTDHKRTPDWEDLRSFIALARAGRLSLAAKALGVNHATIARRLTALETCLGVDLFERRPQGYVLTQDGQAALNMVLPMEEAALDIGDLRQPDHKMRGLVRISTVLTLGAKIITHLSQVFNQNPDLEFQIMAEARNISLALREADIALRLGRPQSSDLIGRLIGHIQYGFYAALDYDQEIRLIGYDADSDFVPEAQWLNQNFAHTRFVLRSNTQVLQALAAQDGYGIALLPRYLGDANPGLKPMDLGKCPPPRELWLLARAPSLRQNHIRQVADALCQMGKELTLEYS